VVGAASGDGPSTVVGLVADATRTEHTDEMVLDENLVTFSR
jgi:hypothetical protein